MIDLAGRPGLSVAGGSRLARRRGLATGASETATGTCNIGPAELRRRRQSALIAVAVFAAALLAIAAGVLPRWTLPLLAPLFGAVMGTVLQVWLRFCMAFGLAGVAGMGDHAGFNTIAPALRAEHRRRAVGMIAAAALATLAWAAVTAVLVLRPA